MYQTLQPPPPLFLIHPPSVLMGFPGGSDGEASATPLRNPLQWSSSVFLAGQLRDCLYFLKLNPTVNDDNFCGCISILPDSLAVLYLPGKVPNPTKSILPVPHTSNHATEM